MKVIVDVDIDAAAPSGWDVLAEVDRWPEWTPTMNRVRLRGDGPLAHCERPTGLD